MTKDDEYRVQVPAALARELARAARESGQPPRRYVEEVVEAHAAGLRLARIEAKREEKPERTKEKAALR
jgi:hypothetical protein